MDILTNPNRVTVTKNVKFWGKIHGPFHCLPTTSLKIIFVPFLKSWPATIPCKRKKIKWATKLLIEKKGKGKKRVKEKDLACADA